MLNHFDEGSIAAIKKKKSVIEKDYYGQATFSYYHSTVYQFSRQSPGTRANSFTLFDDQDQS